MRGEPLGSFFLLLSLESNSFFFLYFTLLCVLFAEFIGFSSEEIGFSSEEIGFSSEEIVFSSEEIRGKFRNFTISSA